MNPFSCIPPPFPTAAFRPQSDQANAGDGILDVETASSNHVSMMSGGEKHNTQDAVGGASDAHSPTPNLQGDHDDDAVCSELSDSSAEDEVSIEEKIVQAQSCRDEGTRLFKDGQLDAAIQMYSDGVKQFKGVSMETNTTDKDNRMNVLISLHLNLSLCHIKLGNWLEAVSPATSALELDNNNLKALFRRGVARSRLGLLDHARADLLRVCQLDPKNIEARKELAGLKDKEAEARLKNKEAYRGLSAKSTGLYDDREKQIQEQKERE